VIGLPLIEQLAASAGVHLVFKALDCIQDLKRRLLPDRPADFPSSVEGEFPAASVARASSACSAAASLRQNIERLSDR
jgi:hypothetical protein